MFDLDELVDHRRVVPQRPRCRYSSIPTAGRTLAASGTTAHVAGNESIRQRVVQSATRTVAAGTAAMLFGHRVGDPDGPPASNERTEPGEVDFTTRRVFYRET